MEVINLCQNTGFIFDLERDCQAFNTVLVGKRKQRKYCNVTHRNYCLRNTYVKYLFTKIIIYV